MIVSHEHEFIFLKTSKTAGTSVEIALSRFCGPRDVITPIVEKDEALRAELGHRGPQNCAIPLRHYRARHWVRALKQHRRIGCYNHMPAVDVRRLVGEAVWRRYFKFCIERNPWDRVVSLYYWRQRRGGDAPGSIAEFIRAGGTRTLRKRGYHLYTIDGEVAVDRICRFERLAEDLEEVRRRIGLPEALELPRAKAGLRPDQARYRDLLGPAERDAIARDFAPEIALLGYEF